MTRKRPAGITVFAIMNIVLGGLGLACNLCGVVSQAASGTLQSLQQQQQGGPGAFDQQALEKHMAEKIPGVVAIQWGQLAVNMILAVALLFAGIGLLQMKPVARWVSILCGLGIIVVDLAAIVYTIAFVGPAMDSWFKEQPQTQQLPGGFVNAMLLAGTAVPALYIVYCIIMVIYLLMPKTTLAFAPAHDRELGGPEQDYYDPDFQRERREPPPET